MTKEEIVHAYETEKHLMMEKEKTVLAEIEREWGIEEAADTWADWKNDWYILGKERPNDLHTTKDNGNDRGRAKTS